MNQTNVHALEVRLAESRSAEVTREELHQTKMRCNEVVDLLLVLGESFFVSSSKFLLSVEWVRVP